MKKILLLFLLGVLIISCNNQKPSKERSYSESKKAVKEWMSSINNRDREGMFFYTIKGSEAFRFAREMSLILKERDLTVKCYDFNEINSTRSYSEFYVTIEIKVTGERLIKQRFKVMTQEVNLRWKVCDLDKVRDRKIKRSKKNFRDKSGLEEKVEKRTRYKNENKYCPTCKSTGFVNVAGTKVLCGDCGGKCKK